MKKSLLLLSLCFLMSLLNTQAQVLYKDGFTNDYEAPLAPYWGASPAGLEVSHAISSSTVKIVGNGSSAKYATISYAPYDNPQMNGIGSNTGSGAAIASFDMSASPYIYVVVSSTVNIPLTIQLKDVYGYITTASESSVFTSTIGSTSTVYTFSYTDAFDGGYGGSTCTDNYYGCDVDFTQITEFEFQINAGVGNYNGTMIFDYIQVGGSAPYIPSINILEPSYGSSITSAPISLSAATGDNNGVNVDSVRYFDGTTLIGTSTSYEFSFNWNNPSNGSHTITAIAYDHLGITKSSSSVVFTYKKTGCTTSPTIPSIQVSYLKADFTGSHVGGGTPVAYSWDFGDESPSINTMNASHTYTKSGSYTVVYTITDECGNDIATQITVTVSSAVTSTTAAQANIISSNIYPNPANDIAHIEINLRTPSNVIISLTDAIGKEVLTAPQGMVADVNYNIPVANLTKGMYIVRYYINGDVAKASVLIIQ